METEIKSFEEESYKEKYENITYLVNQLQKDLNAEKRRNKGVETLSLCLEEEREKSRSLQEQVKKQDKGISVLQSRLEKNGLSSSLSLKENEFIRPGASRTILDSLITENSKLKSNQKYLNIDPTRFEQALQENAKLKKELESLKSEIISLTKQKKTAEKQLKSSESEKDQQILKLERKISELKQNEDTQSIICDSLSQETVTLRHQLKETMRKMQDQMQKLDDADQRRQRISDDNKYKLQNEELQKQVLAQEQRLKEVTDMNVRWQTYNKQREQYVEELKRKQGKQEHNSGDNIKGLQAQIQQLESRNRQLEEDNRQLHVKLSDANKQISAYDPNKINLYETQIRVITDDFKQERDDRAREHERAERLERELSETKGKLARAEYNYKDTQERLDKLEREQMYNFAEQRQKSLENYEQQYYQQVYGAAAEGRRINRNIGTAQAAYIPRSRVRYECDDGEDDVDENNEGRAEDVVDTVESNDLTCPKCKRVFASNQYDDLLDHTC